MEKLKKLLDPKEIDREKYRAWIRANIPHWKVRSAITEAKEKDLDAKAELTALDFAPNIDDKLKPMVDALVEHYNNTKVFFGMENSF